MAEVDPCISYVTVGKLRIALLRLPDKKDVVTWYIYIAGLLRLTRTNRNMEKEIGTVIDQTKVARKSKLQHYSRRDGD